MSKFKLPTLKLLTITTAKVLTLTLAAFWVANINLPTLNTISGKTAIKSNWLTSNLISQANASSISESDNLILGCWKDRQGQLSIFTPEGKVYIIRENSSEAVSASYRITMESNQPNIIMGALGRMPIRFITNNKMWIDNPDMIFEKVSNSVILPSGVNVVLIDSVSSAHIARVKESEANQRIRQMERAQQAYYLEYSKFANNISDLNIGMKSETENYSYSIRIINNAQIQNLAVPRRKGLKGFTSVVFSIKGDNNETSTSAITCKANSPSQNPLSAPQRIGVQPTCPVGSTEMNK